MKKVQNSAALFFIISVVILATISIFGVWDILDEDVITKSFRTLGLLAAVAVIVMVAGRFIDSRHEVVGIGEAPLVGTESSSEINPMFTSIRHATLAILIVSVVLLALFGIMAIWEVLSGEVMEKSLSSIGILAFSSFVIVLTCLERENHKILRQGGKPISGGMAFLIIMGFFWILVSMF